MNIKLQICYKNTKILTTAVITAQEVYRNQEIKFLSTKYENKLYDCINYMNIF